MRITTLTILVGLVGCEGAGINAPLCDPIALYSIGPCTEGGDVRWSCYRRPPAEGMVFGCSLAEIVPEMPDAVCVETCE